MTPSELDEALSELETRLERLRALYEQYFMGLEKVPPEILRKDVDRRIYVMRREQIRNTAKRFKLQTLIQRYNTFQQYWARICREIEEGTYRRHLERARRRMSEKEALTIAAKRRFGTFNRRHKKEPEQAVDDSADAGVQAVADFEASLTAALGLGSASLALPSVPSVTANPAKRAREAPDNEPSILNEAPAPADRALSEQLLRAPSPSTKSPAEQASRRTPWGSLSMPPSERASARVTAPGAPPREAAAQHAGGPEPKPRPPSAIVFATPKTLAQAAQAGRGKVSAPPVAVAKPPAAAGGAFERAAASVAGVQMGAARAVAPPAPSRVGVRATADAAAANPAVGASLRASPVVTVNAAPPKLSGAASAAKTGGPRPPSGTAAAARIVGGAEARAPARPQGAGTAGAERGASRGASPVRIGTVDAERLAALHQQLLAAKRQTNDPSPITLDGLGRKLEVTAAKLRAQHGDRQIDFDVVIRDGRPIIKPKVR